jgi:hypothetical protein
LFRKKLPSVLGDSEILSNKTTFKPRIVAAAVVALQWLD